jgi:site-specific DNA-methyltransferase (adenine-specific)
MRYFPIMKKGLMRKKGGGKSNLLDMEMSESINDDYYPKSVLEFSNAKRGEHPTQKPLDLMKYLVMTYSEQIYPESDIIFDPFAGSGTTLVAAKQLGRKFLGCERSERYVKICEERLRQDYLFANI